MAEELKYFIEELIDWWEDPDGKIALGSIALFGTVLLVLILVSLTRIHYQQCG